jgi:small-conductance mechanosensitive channel
MSQQTAARQDPPAAEAKPAPLLKERWTQLVALTTTILAVCAAISSLKGGGYSTKVQLATTRENDRWAQYQSKSIKQNLFAVEQSLLQVQALEAKAPEAKAAIAARVAKLQGELERYDQEKAKLKAEAEAIQHDEASFQRIGGNFGLAVMLLQIAIMLSSVGALMKKPIMWVVGLVFGAIGLTYMANGFFGWF